MGKGGLYLSVNFVQISPAGWNRLLPLFFFKDIPRFVLNKHLYIPMNEQPFPQICQGVRHRLPPPLQPSSPPPSLHPPTSTSISFPSIVVNEKCAKVQENPSPRGRLPDQLASQSSCLQRKGHCAQMRFCCLRRHNNHIKIQQQIHRRYNLPHNVVIFTPQPTLATGVL